VTRVYKDRYGSEVAPGVCKVRRRGATALACIRAPSCSTTMYSSTSIMASRSVSVPRQCRSSASEYVSACGHSLGRGISYDFCVSHPGDARVPVAVHPLHAKPVLLSIEAEHSLKMQLHPFCHP